MNLFHMDWWMEGSAVIEADDAVEAHEILIDGLNVLDSSMFEMIDVHRINAQPRPPDE